MGGPRILGPYRTVDARDVDGHAILEKKKEYEYWTVSSASTGISQIFLIFLDFHTSRYYSILG